MSAEALLWIILVVSGIALQKVVSGDSVKGDGGEDDGGCSGCGGCCG